jgi:hypothetical protein
MKSLSFIFSLSFIMAVSLLSCSKDDDSDEVNNVRQENIIGTWQLFNSSHYGLQSIEFTNYGVAIESRTLYLPTKWNYSYNNTLLKIEDILGIGIISKNGDTLVIKGFNSPEAFGSEGIKGPCINGTFIKQNK